MNAAALKTLPIIDIDTHFTEPGDLWSSRAPAKYKDKVLHTRIGPNGHEAWYIGDEYITFAGPGVIDRSGDKVRGVASLPTLDAMHPASSQPEPRLAVMDNLGISAALLYPNAIGFGASRLMHLTQDEDLRLFHVQAYNDAIAELQRQGKGRLYPQAVLPLWTIEGSLKELKRCREKLGLTGIAVTDTPEAFGQPSYANPVWEPLFAACEDLRLPINFHVGSGEADKKAGYWGTTEHFMADGSTKLDAFVTCYVSAQLFLSNIKTILNLIVTGMLEKYPRLKFVSVESGIGWIPFLIASVEYTIEELLGPSERRKFRRSPREMFKQQIYASYWFENKRAVETYIEEFGCDNLMFETDYPHPQCLFPNPDSKIAETLSSYNEATQRKILYQNAAQLYGIRVD
jgi:uncharacterized protein